MHWLSLLVLCGCFASEPAPPPAQPVTIANVAPVASKPLPLPKHSEWLGRYTCAQGSTALRLAIDLGTRNNTVSAIFEFGPLEENPRVPHGSYRMTGVLQVTAAGELQLDLAPYAWLEQPPNYVMVGLTATSDARRATFRGHIDDPSCSDVELARSE